MINHLSYVQNPKTFIIEEVNTALVNEWLISEKSAFYDFLGALGLVPHDRVHLE